MSTIADLTLAAAQRTATVAAPFNAVQTTSLRAGQDATKNPECAMCESLSPPGYNFFPGTGGIVSAEMMHALKPQMSGALMKMVFIGTPMNEVVDLPPAPEAVDEIRQAFRLSITDLATLLGVERPTIYSWLRDASSPTRARLPRLQLALELARLWTKVGGSGVKLDLKSQIMPGISLAAAMESGGAWRAEIEASLIAQARTKKESRASERVSAAIRDSRFTRVSDENFDLLTGRPFLLDP